MLLNKSKILPYFLLHIIPDFSAINYNNIIEQILSKMTHSKNLLSLRDIY